jgi:SAM-dependent methyltransferase
MGRTKSHRPGLHETGFLTARAMVANLAALIRAHLRPALDVRPGAPVLDVGCGEQPYKALLAGRRLVGVNLDAENADPDVIGDGLRLPFKTGSFPAAVCTQVIEHVPDPGLLLREIGRCLEPGGLLLLSGPMYWPLHEEPFDFWRFTRHGMRRILADNGFDLVELRDDGNAVAMAVTAVNHLFPGRALFPIRMAANAAGLLLQAVYDPKHSTPNLSLVARAAARAPEKRPRG